MDLRIFDFAADFGEFWYNDDFSAAIRAISLKISHRSDLLLDLVEVGSNDDLDLSEMEFQRKSTLVSAKFPD